MQSGTISGRNNDKRGCTTNCPDKLYGNILPVQFLAVRVDIEVVWERKRSISKGVSD